MSTVVGSVQIEHRVAISCCCSMLRLIISLTTFSQLAALAVSGSLRKTIKLIHTQRIILHNNY
ncbi:hypothetical protein SB6423_05247 [Klebsiella pasteurii]|nr:hypothetical protein SB6423_05247 [Klebsiella pasteurii]